MQQQQQRGGRRQARGGGGGGASAHADRTRQAQLKVLEDQRRRAAAVAQNAAEEDEVTCLVCCEPLAFAAIGVCDHALCCALCTSRLRILHNDRRCVLCKADLERVFVSLPDRKFADFQTWGDSLAGPGLTLDEPSGMFFDEAAGAGGQRVALEGLRQLRCGVPGCRDADRNWDAAGAGGFAALNAHLQSAHAQLLCKLCWESRGAFPMEQTRFSKRDHDKHCAEGEPGTAFRGHPMCKFCRTRFYDNDGLYAHLKEKHESCHICQRSGRPYEYFRDYANLYRHFERAHFVCTEADCVANKFNVFESELELRGHRVSNHPHLRVDRTIPVQFVVRPRGADGSGVDASDDGQRGGRGRHQQQRGRDAPPPAIDSIEFEYLPNSAQDPPLRRQQAPSRTTTTTPPPDPAQQESARASAAVEARYSAALGAQRSGMQDEAAFPALGGGSGGGAVLASAPGGWSASGSAVRQAPAARGGISVLVRPSQGRGKKAAPKPLTRDEEDREAIRRNTQRSAVPMPAPAPAPPAAASSASQDAAAQEVLGVVSALEGRVDTAEFLRVCRAFRLGFTTPDFFHSELRRLVPAEELQRLRAPLLRSLPDASRAQALEAVWRSSGHGAAFATAASAGPAAALGLAAAAAGPAPSWVGARAAGGATTTAAPRARAGDFPALGGGSGGGGSGARPRKPTSAIAQWDELRKSNQIKSGVTFGSKPKKAPKKKKAPKDDMFSFH